MIKNKVIAVITLSMLIISMLVVPAAAQESTDVTVMDKLAAVEKTIYGVAQTGALMDRVTTIERDVYGKETTEAILPRVDKLYAHILVTTEQKPSMVTRVNAVEWMFSHGVVESPLKSRIENLERTINGSPSTGSLEERLTKLLKIAYTNGQFEVVSTVVPKDTLIKIKILAPLSSKQSRVGDEVSMVADGDVVIDGVLIVPNGAKANGKITKVESAGSFGKDAKLEIAFNNVGAADGTSVKTFLGEKAKEETKSMAKAAGASVAGMVILGPIGIIGGAFVNGSEANIPAGTQIYVQTKDEVEVYGIRVK